MKALNSFNNGLPYLSLFSILFLSLLFSGTTQAQPSVIDILKDNGRDGKIKRLRNLTTDLERGNYYYEERAYRKALPFYDKIAQQGNAEAQYKLALIYHLSKKNYKKIPDLMKRSAQQGNAQAQAFLGEMYYKGLYVNQDYNTAAFWLKKAVKQGELKAQFYLGVMYLFGYGVNQDYKKEADLMKRPALKGNADAQLFLGVMYFEGKGVAQDHGRGNRWIKKAALQGNHKAQEQFLKKTLPFEIKQFFKNYIINVSSFNQETKSNQLKQRQNPHDILF